MPKIFRGYYYLPHPVYSNITSTITGCRFLFIQQISMVKKG